MDENNVRDLQFLTTKEKFGVCDKQEMENVDEKEKKNVPFSFREKLKADPVYKRNFIYAMFMAISFMALGMCVGQHGPTFMDIQIITDTDLETASAFFTAGNFGYLVGCMVTGLIYNKVSTPMLVFVTILCLGISNIALPYCTLFIAMISIRFASSAFGGGLDTGLNSEHMTLWGSDANGLLQFLYFSYSFGGVISPLFAEPFLAEKMSLAKANETALNESLYSYNNTSADTQSYPETNVEYVFLITGIFTIVTAFPFLYIYFKRDEKSKENCEKRNFSQRSVPFPILILMLCGLCLFYFTYCCVEDTFFSFLMTFLVEEYDSVSKSKGAFVTAIAWASFAIARFLMIFVTKIFTTVQILLILTTAMAISFSAFTLFAHFRMVDALIVVVAFASLAFSGVFPAGLSWTEREMFPVTGIISSCIFVSSSLGAMVNPLILGSLMEEHTNMWFCYLLMIHSFAMYFIFIILLLFSRYYIDKKYGSLASHQNKAREINISIPNIAECDTQINEEEVHNKLM